MVFDEFPNLPAYTLNICGEIHKQCAEQDYNLFYETGMCS